MTVIRVQILSMPGTGGEPAGSPLFLPKATSALALQETYDSQIYAGKNKEGGFFGAIKLADFVGCCLISRSLTMAPARYSHFNSFLNTAPRIVFQSFCFMEPPDLMLKLSF